MEPCKRVLLISRYRKSVRVSQLQSGVADCHCSRLSVCLSLSFDCLSPLGTLMAVDEIAPICTEQIDA